MRHVLFAKTKTVGEIYCLTSYYVNCLPFVRQVVGNLHTPVSNSGFILETTIVNSLKGST